MIWTTYVLLRGGICLAVTIAFCVYLARDLFQEAVVRLKLRKHRRRFAPGRCGKCGYDVRASPFRCPECGEPTGRPAPPPKKLL